MKRKTTLPQGKPNKPTTKIGKVLDQTKCL
jgi:hypothetical protein